MANLIEDIETHRNLIINKIKETITDNTIRETLISALEMIGGNLTISSVMDRSVAAQLFEDHMLDVQSLLSEAKLPQSVRSSLLSAYRIYLISLLSLAIDGRGLRAKVEMTKVNIIQNQSQQSI